MGFCCAWSFLLARCRARRLLQGQTIGLDATTRDANAAVAFTADDPFRGAPAAMPAATPHNVIACFFDLDFRNAISCQSNVERPKELARRAVLALAPVGSAYR